MAANPSIRRRSGSDSSDDTSSSTTDIKARFCMDSIIAPPTPFRREEIENLFLKNDRVWPSSREYRRQGLSYPTQAATGFCSRLLAWLRLTERRAAGSAGCVRIGLHAVQTVDDPSFCSFFV
jgi:hypothetical protein